MVVVVGVGVDVLVQVVFGLVVVEVGIGVLGIGVLDIDDGFGQWLVVGIVDVVLEEYYGVGVVVVVYLCFVIVQWCVGDVQWFFDGVWCVVGEVGFGVLGVEQQVQVMFQVQFGGQQVGFLVVVQVVQVVYCFLEFVGCDLYFFDQFCCVVEDVLYQGFGVWIVVFVELVVGFFEEVLDIGSLGNFYGYGVCFCLLLLGVGREFQWLLVWIDEGCW